MNDCCQQLENRKEGPGPRGGEEREDMTVTHCVVCGCRHYEVTIDPGELGLRGARI